MKKRLCAQRFIEDFLENIYIDDNLVSFTILFSGEGGDSIQTEIYHCPETEEVTMMLIGLSDVLEMMKEEETNWIPCSDLTEEKMEDLKCHELFGKFVQESYGSLLEKAQQCGLPQKYEYGYEDMALLAAILFKMITVFAPEMKEMIQGRKIQLKTHCDTVL